MYHYATMSFARVGVRENVVHLWRNHIPKEAIKHPFLMHGLLALAALHQAYLQPELSSGHWRTFSRHHAVALDKFRSVLSSPSDPTLADALLALAGTLSVSSMAQTCTQADAAALDMDTITELFILTRGVKNVIDLTCDHIMAGPMAALLETSRCPEVTEIVLPPIVLDQFEALDDFLILYGMDMNALEHCQTAMAQLRVVYRDIAYASRMGNLELGVISRWQVLVSMEYIKLIQTRIPPALIILAHYVAAMAVVETAWYTQDWAESALRGISQVLDISIQHWIHWPMEQVRDRLRILRIPLRLKKKR